MVGAAVAVITAVGGLAAWMDSQLTKKLGRIHDAIAALTKYVDHRDDEILRDINRRFDEARLDSKERQEAMVTMFRESFADRVHVAQLDVRLKFLERQARFDEPEDGER